jgi:hypothetical protein
VCAAHAQGTLQYFADLDGSTAVPFNPNYAWQGTAQFGLSGDTLSFTIGFNNFSAGFDQARLIGMSTTPILDLGQAQRVAPDPLNGNSGGALWTGMFTFTPQQRTEFLAGGISLGMTPTRLVGDTGPIGEIIGAIQPVPEPSTIVLLCVGTALLALRLRQARPR